MFQQIKTIKQLASFLGADYKVLKELKADEHYITFEIPKPGKDEKRIIEAPVGILKNLLDRLADHLQWCYSDHRTEAAQGYIRSVKNDPDKRTIFTNASKHLGKKYLLNIDLDNYFHQVDEQKVREIFSDDRFFAFETDAVERLVSLVCYRGRLPMGSPSSPPLSNFAAYDLDLELTRWAKHQKISHTRFVDDLSFSSNLPLTDIHFEIIKDILWMHRFVPDPGKIKWYGPDDTKEVTGIIVDLKLSLPPEYLGDLELEMRRLKDIKQYALIYPDYNVLEWIQKLEKVLDGRMAFVKAVYGREHEAYKNLLAQKALVGECEPHELSISWRYAGYEYYSM